MSATTRSAGGAGLADGQTGSHRREVTDHGRRLTTETKSELAALHARLGISTVYVTHDQVEAMTLGTRVAVMKDGRILQADAPEVLYRKPASIFVAGFMGSPAMNLFDVVTESDAVTAAGMRLPLDGKRRPRLAEGSRVVLGIRPEDFYDAAYADQELPSVDVTVTVIERLGSEAHVLFRGGTNGSREAPWAHNEGRYFTAVVSPGTTARAGAPFTLAVDPSCFHFFDPETGASLLT